MVGRFTFLGTCNNGLKHFRSYSRAYSHANLNRSLGVERYRHQLTSIVVFLIVPIPTDTLHIKVSNLGEYEKFMFIS